MFVGVGKLQAVVRRPVLAALLCLARIPAWWRGFGDDGHKAAFPWP